MTAKTIKALERGVAVMRVLHSDTTFSLQQLFEQTGIAKATLLRILGTLEREKVVRRCLGDGRYRCIPLMNSADITLERHAQYAAIAAPYLKCLQECASWPSDLLVYDRYRMCLAETTRRYASLADNARYKLGSRVDIFLSAPGRAYLAFCGDQEREDIFAYYRSHPPANPRSAYVFRHDIDAIIIETRRRGYALRDPMFGGMDEDITEFDDRLDAIAVPLMHRQHIFGCINMVWVRKYNLRPRIVCEHLDKLTGTAKEISAALFDSVLSYSYPEF